MDQTHADLWLKWLGTLLTLGALVTGMFTYVRNSKTKTAEFLMTLHKAFFAESTYQQMKMLLDCDGVAEEGKLEAMVQTEPPEFTDFLNFFELVAYLDSVGTLARRDSEALLGYYFNLLREKKAVWNYIQSSAKGFENLRKLLAERKTQ